MDIKKIKITKDTLIEQIATDSYTSKGTVRSILDSLEERIFDSLSLASEEYPNVVVKLFEGINIEATYIPEKDKKNNLTGKLIRTISKIKPKTTFTRTYCEKLSSRLKK